MDKKKLSERDICSKFITPAITNAGWDLHTQIREEVGFTKGRIIVRGKLHTRGEQKRADKKGVLTADAVCEYMSKSTADSTRYPDDNIFQAAITNLPLYDRLAQYKVRAVLEALDEFLQTSKSEA